MADVLIRSFSKILSLLVGPTNVAIDNWTFQMFYKVTPMLLGACVILVCTRSVVLSEKTLEKKSDIKLFVFSIKGNKAIHLNRLFPH